MLATKLHVPARTNRLISRPVLVQALGATSSYKLTLLDAPAGWGKTTLLTQWIAQAHGRPRFAWLSLDQADNDPVRFWTYALAAMQQANPKLATHAFELLQGRADVREVVLPTLLNELAGLEDEIVLLLDDYHVVTDRDIHEQLAFVIDRMPASLRLVLATRSDPALPLARLRAGGDLLEIRAHDLRFAVAEADLLLNDVLGLDLTAEEVSVLCRRTEGWAAGLYLAALSLEGRLDAGPFISAFAGDDRHIVDYLSAEVLDGQPGELRAFLLRTSILDRLCGPLCDAVLQTSASLATLERIERENLFLVALDSARRWYRYHQLFAELLRSELLRTEPELVTDLHDRAAAWFRAEGSVDDALHHLLAARDVPSSTELIAASWGAEFNRGRLSTVSRWLDLLPDRAVAEDPRLCLARAWIALDLRELSVAGRWINAAEAGLAGGDTMQAEMTIIHAVQRFKVGDVTAAVDAARQAIGVDPGDSAPGRAAAYCVYGAALYWSGKPPEARAAFDRAVQLAEGVGNDAARTYALGYLATIAAEHGRLTEAEDLIQRATGGDRDVAVGEHFTDMMTSLATAKVLSRRGETALADDAAHRAVVLGQRGGGNVEIANALLVRAEILHQLGDPETARRSTERARRILRACPDPGPAHQLLATTARRTGADHLRGG